MAPPGRRFAVALLLAVAATAVAPADARAVERPLERHGAPRAQHRAASARRALQDGDVAWESAVTDGALAAPLWSAVASGDAVVASAPPLTLELLSDEAATLTLAAATPVSRLILVRCLLSAEPLNASVRLQLTGSLSSGELTASAVDLAAADGAPQPAADGTDALAFVVSAESLGFESGSSLAWSNVSFAVANATRFALLNVQLLRFSPAPPAPAPPWTPPFPTPPLAPPPALPSAPLASPSTPPPLAPAPPPPGAPDVPPGTPAAPPPAPAPPAPPLPPAVVPVANASSYRFFDRDEGLAPLWADASCGASAFNIGALDAGGVALSTQLAAGGCASLLGPPFQGWWALSFWVQASAEPASASLLVSLDLVATAGQARAGLSSAASAVVALDAATLAGSGRRLPRRRLAADAAAWAHIVIPLQQFRSGTTDVWNRVVFQVRHVGSHAFEVNTS
jgi:hypothetical protein